MTNCLGKSYSFGLLSFANVINFCLCPFSFGFEVGMLDLIVLISDHCLSVYFSLAKLRPIFFLYVLHNQCSQFCYDLT